MSVINILKIAKAGKDAKKQVEDSGINKNAMISKRVDQLKLEYQVYRRIVKNDKDLASIKARMKAIKGELTELARTMADLPKPSKDMVIKHTEAVLEAKITSEMAQLQLMQVYTSQLYGDLPDDDTNHWAGRRARFVQARDQIRLASNRLLFGASDVQKDIDSELTYQSEQSDDLNRPGVKGDAVIENSLVKDNDKSRKKEEELKEEQRGFQRLAAMFAAAAEKWDKLIEVGDLTHKKK